MGSACRRLVSSGVLLAPQTLSEPQGGRSWAVATDESRTLALGRDSLVRVSA